MPEAALASGILLDRRDARASPARTTPRRATIKATGGFGDPADRPERLERLRWALDRTVALGLSDLMLHAGFLPEPDDPDRPAMLDTLAQAGQLAAEKGITLAFETGQETADLLRRTLDDLKAPEPQGQLRPGQHAPLRHGRPDPRRRDPRPRHPQRPRQGRAAADHPRPVGRGSAARPRRGRHPPVRPDPRSRSATPARSSSSARSATRPAGCATSPTAWTTSRSAWPSKAERSPAKPGHLGAVGSGCETSWFSGSSDVAPGDRRSMRGEPAGLGASVEDQLTTELTTWASSRPASVGRRSCACRRAGARSAGHGGAGPGDG